MRIGAIAPPRSAIPAHSLATNISGVTQALPVRTLLLPIRWPQRAAARNAQSIAGCRPGVPAAAVIAAGTPRPGDTGLAGIFLHARAARDHDASPRSRGHPRAMAYRRRRARFHLLPG